MWGWHETEVTEPSPPQWNRDEAFSHVEIDTDDEMSNVPTNGELTVNGERVPGGVDMYRCVVCSILPFVDLFQCRQGHLICAGCYQLRVLDKMLGNQLGTCPQCGVRIYRHQPYRNIVGEQRLADIVMSCEKCELRLPRGQMRFHCINECPNRLVACKYKRIGCEWKGRMGVLEEAHLENCEYRHKTGSELFSELRRIQDKRDEKQKLLVNIMKLLQLPQITARWLHLLPHADTFPLNRFVVGPNFEAFGQRWCVKFMWQTPNSSNEPTDPQTDRCALIFKLCLESTDCLQRRLPLGLTYSMISSIYTDIRFQPNLCEKFDFTSENVSGPTAVLYENTWQNLAVLLNNRGFYARLLMARI